MDLYKYYREKRSFSSSIEDESSTEQEDANFDFLDSSFPFHGENIAVVPHYPEYDANMREHRHSFFEFVYVYRGECRIQVDSASFTMSKGDLCLFNLQAVHTIRTSSDEPVIFNILIRKSQMEDAYFRLFALPKDEMIDDFFLESMQKKSITDNYLLFHPHRDSLYEEMVQSLIREFFEDRIYKHEMYGLLLAALLIELARLHRQEALTASQRDFPSSPLSDILPYISENCRTVSIASLAQHVNYSPAHLSALIKRYYSCSFSDLLKSARLTRAAALLKETDLSVSEIMEQIGCSNRTWFTKKFRERYGTSPGAYRSLPPS